MSIRPIRLIAAAGLATALLTGVGVASAGAAPSDAGGYLWASSPTSPSYNAPAPYSWNSAGATNHITRVGVGKYQVLLNKVGRPGGTVQVTSYGTTSSNCMVNGWKQSGKNELVNVNCFKPGSTELIDATYTMLYSQPTGPGNSIAYALANMPSKASYTPTLAYQFNNRGGHITVKRTSAGVYTLTIPGIPSFPTTVKVTPDGSGAGTCVINGWGPNSAGTAQLVHVDCFAVSGSPADTEFVATMANEMNLLGNNSATSAAAWGNEPTAGSYTPDTDYQWNLSNFSGGLGPALTIEHGSGPGSYTVSIPDQGEITDGGSVQVSAYGTTPGFCQVTSWAPDGTTMEVGVGCHTRTGSPVNELFTMQFTGQE